MSTPRLCLIEDDVIMGESLVDRFRLEGFQVRWLTRGDSALEALASEEFDMVVSDIRLPDMEGSVLLDVAAAKLRYLPPWIFITGYGSVDQAVSLLKRGAVDYITKPFELDRLVEKLQNLCRQCVDDETANRLGLSPAMRRIAQLLPRVAREARTVLITGESGSGKEVIANEIHRLDPVTANGPFIAVNCAALPEQLLEAELFGHERGAFTGALRTRPGVFEQAQGGTLFLDEVGDMPLSMQAKLLRVIQERRVVRVGGEIAIPVQVRLVCATHRDLRAMVEEKSFREDLFYRINVIQLRVPPLRERREDILWLAHRFLDEYAKARGTPPLRLSAEAEQALLAHPWPGNVRELKHAIERACILSEGPVIEPEMLFDAEVPGPGRGEALEPLTEYILRCEKSYIEAALAQCEGRVGKTAERLGISRKTLWEKMRRLNLMAPE